MKITLDARMLNMSGIGRYVKSIIPFLKDNFDMTLLGNPDELNVYQVKIIEMNSKIYSPFEQWELFRKIPVTDIFWSPHFNIPVLPVKAFKRAVTIHDVFQITPYSALGLPQKIYSRYLIKNAIYKSDIVFTISNFTKNEMLRYFNIDEKKSRNIKVIYHYPSDNFKKIEFSGIEKESFLNGLKITGDFLLYVGNVKPHKNIRGLLRSFAKIIQNGKNLQLILTGQKDNFITGFKDVISLVEELKIEKNVIFTGILDDGSLTKLYNSAKALILPSFYEGFGRPPLEAMACGCPVIASDIPPLKEIYGDSAYYIDPYSDDNMSRGILTVFNDEALREELVPKGLIKSGEYSYQKNSHEYLNILNNLF